MIGTAGLPHVIIRFFTVPKVSDARLSAGWALVFIAILYTTAPAVAAMARLNLTETVNNRPYAEIVNKDKKKEFDQFKWLQQWENTGLLAWMDKNDDGVIQYSEGTPFIGKPEFKKNEVDDKTVPERHPIVGQRMLKNKPTDSANELYVDKDIIVLANPEIARLPGWVIALVVAGGLAAALSTAAGLLLAISSAVSHDLLKGILKPEITEKEELNASRIAMVGAIIVAGYFGLNPPGFAAGTVAMAFGLAASSIFPVLMLGIFSKRMNRQGAIAGMIAGISVTLLYVFQHKGILFIPGTDFLAGMNPNWFLGISPEAFGAVGAVVNFAVAFIVSHETAPPPEEAEDLVERIRTPGD